MINKIFVILSFLSLFLAQSQQLHIKYIYTNPANILFQEDLYISDNHAAIVRHPLSDDKYKNQINTNNNDIEILGKLSMNKIEYYKSTSNNIIIAKDYVGDNLYCVIDKLPKIKWNTDYKDTKKIGKYLCKKATADYRGSKITAYYTPELLFSFGPYKFDGLAGLILEVTEDNSMVNSWKTDLIELNPDDKIKVNAPKIDNTITYQEFIKLQEDNNLEDVKKLIPKEAKVEMLTVERNGIEKKYEWEN